MKSLYFGFCSWQLDDAFVNDRIEGIVQQVTNECHIENVKIVFPDDPNATGDPSIANLPVYIALDLNQKS